MALLRPSHSPAKIMRSILIGTGAVVVGPTTQWSSFIGFMPDDGDSHDDIVVLSDVGSDHQERSMRTGFVFERYQVEIVLRSDSYETGREKLSNIMEILDSEERSTVTIATVDYEIPGFSRNGGLEHLGVERVGSRRRNLFRIVYDFSIVTRDVSGTLTVEGNAVTTDTGNLGTANAITVIPAGEISHSSGNFGSGLAGQAVTFNTLDWTFDPFSRFGYELVTSLTHPTTGNVISIEVTSVTIDFQASFALILSGDCLVLNTIGPTRTSTYQITINASGYNLVITLDS